MIKKITDQYKSAYTGLPREVWYLTLVVLINRTGSIVLFFMALYLTKVLSFSLAAAGQMISIYGIGAMIGTYFGGILSDKIGTKKIQFFSLLLTGIGYFILSTAESAFQIGFLLLLIAIVAEAFRPANAAAIAHVCPPLIRPRGFALQRLAINLGVTIGPALGGLLAGIGYKYIFILNGITSLSAAITFWFVFRSFEIDKKTSAEEKPLAAASPYKDKIFLTVQLFFLFLGLVFIQVMNTWPVFLNTVYNLPEYQIGSLLTVNAMIVVVFELPVIHRLEAYNHLRIISIGTLLLFWGFGLLPFGSDYLYAVFTVIVWSIGEILVFPLIFSFVSNRAPKESYGKYMGITTFTFSLTYVFGPAFGTFVYDNFSPATLWISLGILGILVSIGFQYLNRILRKENLSIL